MTKRLFMLLAASALMSCQQAPLPDQPVSESVASTSAKPEGYIALPGQAATSDTPSDTTAAFEFAAALYGAEKPAAPAAEPQSAAPPPIIPPDKPTTPAAPIPDPRPVNDPITPARRPAPTASSTPQESTAALITATPPRKPSSRAPYAVQVTNGTSGRLFIEMQDEGGNIFPVGFMHADQRIGSGPQEPRLIQGQLIVVIRDPDRPGAPEIRRYHISPPAEYQGKTVGITILPGGRYRASVDGQVYFTSAPEETPA